MNIVSNYLQSTVQSNPAMAIKDLLSKGGPDKIDYPVLDKILQDLANQDLSEEQLKGLRSFFDEKFMNNTMQGFGIRKPYGYSGDFKIIDMIYTEHTSELPEFVKWDQYFHKQAAPIAVRNRKTYFKSLIKSKLEKSQISLLNVASGPARDLCEVYLALSRPEQLQTSCVELDPNAIAHAKQLCSPFLSQIEFHQKNILRFQTEKKFDLVWSAGLFDYFEDRIFVMALKKFQTFLKPGGEIVIGNFSLENPSRPYMELFGDWYLIHRSPEELTSLAISAGFNANQISIQKEALGVNLFMHIQC
ncbi:MAG: class I SAM-dependent methyltransferase [Saprospiraceae bacterium]|nr:class I SAM-dependent methyltransferase [Saprospiraceae bacterium]